MTGDILVDLRQGTHTLASTLYLGSSDSGSNGYNVIYQNYPGESPIVSGGRDLSGGWSLYNSSKNIWRKTGVTGSFRQLYVFGTWATRARQPNLTNDASGGDFYNYTVTPYPYSVPSAYVGSWANAGTAEMVWTSAWSQNRARIAGATTVGNLSTLTFKSPESTFAIDHHPNPGNGTGLCYFENAYDFLDQPGEWFLDTAAATLYYIPKSTENMATAKVNAPGPDTLIELGGTSSSPLHHVQFFGINFYYSGWNGPSSYGYVDGQGGFMYQTQSAGGSTPTTSLGTFSPMPGMINLRYTNDVKILENAFINGGSWGIMEYAGSDHNTYAGNHFQYLAAGGICLGNLTTAASFYDLATGTSAYDVVRSNLVDNVGYSYRDAVPILGGNIKYVTITRNEVRNAPYTGISFGWGWTDSSSLDSHDNTVSYNRIHNVTQLLVDGGGIYTLSRMDNTFIDHNYVYNALCGPVCSAIQWWHTTTGIYLDNGSAYKTVTNNVVDNTAKFTYTAAGSPPSSAHDNIALNNYYNNSQDSENLTGYVTYSNNVSSFGAQWPQAAIDIMNQAGVEPTYHSLSNIISRGANLAIGGVPSATSIYAAATPASSAIDNNTESGLWASDGVETNPWWQVSLGSSYQVYEVDIEDRQDLDQPFVRANFDVRLYSSLAQGTYTTGASIGATPAFYHLGVLPAVLGRGAPWAASTEAVRVARTNNGGHFNFAEVKVYGLPLPPADAKARWNFDSNGTDSTGHGYNATLYNGAVYNTADAKNGTASLSVAGNNAYAGANLVTTVTDNVTLSAWAKWNGATGDEFIIYNGHSGYSGYGILLYTGNGMKLTVLLGGVNFLNANVGLEPGKWTHLAAVRRNGFWELWVNGSMVSLTNSGTAPAVPFNSTWLGLNFTGLIDNARIHERALSVGEIQALAFE